MSYQNQRFAILDENDQLKLVTLEQWAKWMGNHRNERILRRDVIDGYVVSTIFIGLDSQWHPNGRPLYWETMVFDPPAGRRTHSGRLRSLGDEMYQVHYSTASEARKGHAQAVEWLKEQLKR